MADLVTELRTGRGVNEGPMRDAWVHAKMQEAADRIEQLEAALAVRPIKPRHHPEKLRRMTGEDGYHKGWQEALTALGNARAALEGK